MSSLEHGEAVSSAARCFHCELPIPAGIHVRSSILGQLRDFCCPGCQAIAETIAENGLDTYYRLRTASPPTASGRGAIDARLFDREEFQKSVVRRAGSLREVSLLLEGVRCPACLWLNEQRLRALPGVVEVVVSYAGRSARVRWDPSRLALSGILAAVWEIGYKARPFDPSHRIGVEREAARRDAERLVFAGVLGMTVMSLAVAVYFLGGPGAAGRLPLWETFARWCSMLGSAILLAYPGQDFFIGAWRDLRHRRVGMDVPIVLGLVAAWAGSGWATVKGSGPVYYDAVAMLVFFVLLARALETRARLSVAAVLDPFAVIEPATAHRLGEDGHETEIAAFDLVPGDVIRIRQGEIVPADGVLLQGRSSFDEAMLTGEPWPRSRGPGDLVVAGSFNRGQPSVLRVTRTGEASTLGEIRRLLEEGLASRPRVAEMADRLAAPLVVVVLLLTAATAVWWLVRDRALALPATVAVLMITCPCALALATPLALALTAGRLARIGVLPARMAGIEHLAGADTAAFDKTGTLTLARPRLETIRLVGGLHRETTLGIAAALEASSEHPVARALREAAAGAPASAEAVVHYPGQGVSGSIDGVDWWIGSPGFALGPAGMPAELEAFLAASRERGHLVALLADRQGRAALFTFAEELRPGAEKIVGDLHRTGIRLAALLSGDAREPVGRLQRALGFDEAIGEMAPSSKLEWIRSQERSGARVLFVGDGLNDAPTLAAAGASVSFADAPQLSRLTSDFLILGRDLGALVAARRVARRSKRLLVQNVGWALAYNVICLPLAAVGLIQPWAAALGMSVSSLVVVINAMRLWRVKPDEKVGGN